MSTFSSNVNGKVLEFTDSSVSYNGVTYDYYSISDVKHRGGDAPAFVFDYNGDTVEIPYNPDDRAIAVSYFKKAMAMTPPPVVEPEPEPEPEPLTSLDAMEDDGSVQEPLEPEPKPLVEKATAVDTQTVTPPADNNVPLAPYTTYSDPGTGGSYRPPQEKKFYQKTWFIILLLILFWPVGLFLMWKFAEWKKPVKIIITCVCAICVIAAFIPTSNTDTSSDTSYEATEETTTEPITEETTTEPTTTTEATTEPPKEFDEDDYESISYENLARTPDDYLGKKITGSGKVIQVIEGDTETQLRVAINDDYDDVILLGYDPSIMDSRVLEDDHITYYGTSTGTITYESTMGGNITIPSCYCDKIVFQ